MQPCVRYLLVASFMLAFTDVNAVGANEDTGKTYRIATEENKNCLPVKREIFRLRHWQWSGIFPFEGGFLPDPHFVCSIKASFPRFVEALLTELSSGFQIIDVNPFFKDESKEIIFAVQSSNQVLYEFKLDYLQNFNVRRAIAGGYPSVRMFPYEGTIAVLAWLDSNLRGYYFIPVPFKSDQNIQIHLTGSVEFNRASEYFRQLPFSVELKDYFCGTGPYQRGGSNIFIAYYQKYRGDCDRKDQDTPLYKNLTGYERWWAPQ